MKRSQKAFEIAVRDWIEGRLTVEGLETWHEFTDRVERGLRTVTQRHDHGSRVIVFSSGGAIGAALKPVLGLGDLTAIELAWIIKNASLTEVLFRPEKMTLLSFNHTPHLEPDQVTYR